MTVADYVDLNRGAPVLPLNVRFFFWFRKKIVADRRNPIYQDMFNNLKRIKESIGYYVKQNKRLVADDRLRIISGEEAKYHRHIMDNMQRIEKLRNYYAQVVAQIEQQTNNKRTL